MSRQRTFEPNWASPPGDTIADVLRDRNISEASFARQLHCSEVEAQALLNGSTPITLAIARDLTQLLGASVEYWMSRDFQYREGRDRIQKDWLDSLPVRDMLRFGWLPGDTRHSVGLETCLDFFGVSRIEEWRTQYRALEQRVAYRTSATFSSHPAAVAAWLRRGEVLAREITCAPWNSKRFEVALHSVRPLTRTKDPVRFLPQLEAICAEAGVAVVVVRAPERCRASGATRFVTEHKAILQLSFRYLTDDQFWFTFFHEAGHLILHDPRAIYLEGSRQPASAAERDANAFASSWLVPRDLRAEFESLKLSGKSIIAFARRAGISPGIVVGQLQHAERLPHSHLNKLKRRYRWTAP